MFSNFSINNFKLAQLIPKAAKPAFAEQRRVGREHFIPVRPSELIDELIQRASFSPEEKVLFRSLCHRLANTFHQESRCRLAELQESYAIVNPDLDTESLTNQRHSPLDSEIAVSQLFDQLGELLERANFRQLTSEEIKSAIGSASALGVRLDVDLDRFDQLAVFARGSSAIPLRRRQWRDWWYRSVEIDIPMYQRLVVVFRLKSSADDASVNAAYMRLFKNVPQQDIDMVLPGGKVRISMLDRGKILVPTISGIGLAMFKISLLLFAGIYGLLKIVGLIGGALGSGWKSVNGYWKTKNKYELNLTRNLYYQNLDNNAGVLLRLSTEAERQELREAVLCYFALLKANKPCTTLEVSQLAEQLLLRCGVDVDFEVADALTKVVRLELCVQTTHGWIAVPLDIALKKAMARNLREALHGEFAH